MKIRKGDDVLVLSGKFRGERAQPRLIELNAWLEGVRLNLVDLDPKNGVVVKLRH